MEKGGGSDNGLRYSPDGKQLHPYHPLGMCGVKLSDSKLEQEKAEIKTSPLLLTSCWAPLCSLRMPAAYQRPSPHHPASPDNAKRISMTRSTTVSLAADSR